MKNLSLFIIGLSIFSALPALADNTTFETQYVSSASFLQDVMPSSTTKNVDGASIQCKIEISSGKISKGTTTTDTKTAIFPSELGGVAVIIELYQNNQDISTLTCVTASATGLTVQQMSDYYQGQISFQYQAGLSPRDINDYIHNGGTNGDDIECSTVLNGNVNGKAVTSIQQIQLGMALTPNGDGTYTLLAYSIDKNTATGAIGRGGMGLGSLKRQQCQSGSIVWTGTEQDTHNNYTLNYNDVNKTLSIDLETKDGIFKPWYTQYSVLLSCTQKIPANCN